jgi:hypothetical protein
MKIRSQLAYNLLVGSLFLAGACGDDDGVTPPPDSPPAFVEQPIDFAAEDGGEVRIENLGFPDGVVRTLNTAYFINAQNGKMPFPNIGMDQETPLECNSIATGNNMVYPFGDDSDDFGSDATWTPGGRHYMDVGPKITFTNADDPTDSFDLVLYEDFVTPFTGGFFHPISYNPEATSEDLLEVIPPEKLGGAGTDSSRKLNVHLPGGPDLPDGYDLNFEGEFQSIQIPPRPVVEADGVHNAYMMDGVPSTNDYSRSEDYVVTWEVPADAPPDLLGFIAIFDTTKSPPQVHGLCVTAAPGKVIIPASFMESMPDNGIIFVAHLLHHLRTLDNVHRIDMVGTSCTSTAFTMVP